MNDSTNYSWPHWLQSVVLGLPPLPWESSPPDESPPSMPDSSTPVSPSAPRARGILDLSQLGDIGQGADRPADGGPPSNLHWLQAALAFSMGLRPSALPTQWPSWALPIPAAAAPPFPSALPRSSWDPTSPSLSHLPFGANAGFPAQPINDDAFARAAFRTRQSVQPDGGRLEGATTAVLENYLPHFATQLQTLPQRAFEASERSRLTGEYDPGPAVETALMMLGLRGLPAIAHTPGVTRRTGEHWRGAMNPMASKSASLYNPPVKPQRPFELDYHRPSTRMERPQMQPDDSPTTSKDGPSSPKELSAEERWADRMKPSRQRNLTPSQRKCLADDLRSLRRLRSQEAS